MSAITISLPAEQLTDLLRIQGQELLRVRAQLENAIQEKARLAEELAKSREENRLLHSEIPRCPVCEENWPSESDESVKSEKSSIDLYPESRVQLSVQFLATHLGSLVNRADVLQAMYEPKKPLMMIDGVTPYRSFCIHASPWRQIGNAQLAQKKFGPHYPFLIFGFECLYDPSDLASISVVFPETQMKGGEMKTRKFWNEKGPVQVILQRGGGFVYLGTYDASELYILSSNEFALLPLKTKDAVYKLTNQNTRPKRKRIRRFKEDGIVAACRKFYRIGFSEEANKALGDPILPVIYESGPVPVHLENPTLDDEISPLIIGNTEYQPFCTKGSPKKLLKQYQKANGQFVHNPLPVRDLTQLMHGIRHRDQVLVVGKELTYNPSDIRTASLIIPVMAVIQTKKSAEEQLKRRRLHELKGPVVLALQRGRCCYYIGTYNLSEPVSLSIEEFEALSQEEKDVVYALTVKGTYQTHPNAILESMEERYRNGTLTAARRELERISFDEGLYHGLIDFVP